MEMKVGDSKVTDLAMRKQPVLRNKIMGRVSVDPRGWGKDSLVLCEVKGLQES